MSGTNIENLSVPTLSHANDSKIVLGVAFA